MNNQSKVILILMLLLILAVSFIGYNYWAISQQEKYITVFQEGQISVVLAIFEKIQQEGSIQLNNGNQTLILVPYQE